MNDILPLLPRFTVGSLWKNGADLHFRQSLRSGFCCLAISAACVFQEIVRRVVGLSRTDPDFPVSVAPQLLLKSLDLREKPDRIESLIFAAQIPFKRPKAELHGFTRG